MGDILPQAPGADDDDVTLVVAAPSQGPQRQPDAAAKGQVGGQRRTPIQYSDQTREKSAPDFDRNR